MPSRPRSRRKSGGVLVPVDGSALSERAIAVAERLAVPAGERIVLLHVVPPVNPARLVRISEAAAYRALEGSFAQAWQYLARLQAPLARRGRTVRTAVRSGQAAEQILACARLERVRLIAMSSHGRSGLRRVLFGSVAQAVLRKARLPVLLVTNAAR
jgi:nucleotide-binding universal stress UspA family protein